MADTSGAKIGSAYGEIRLDGSGVTSGVKTAVGALEFLSTKLLRIDKIMVGALAGGRHALGATIRGVVINAR